ncbi:MAG: pilin, partial [Methylococcales bacterium]
KAKIANAMTSIDAVKTAVSICAQEAGGVLTGCNSGSNGLVGASGFTPTKEVASMLDVDQGTIVITLATGLGQGVDGETITFIPHISSTQTALIWENQTTVTQPAAQQAIVKNNTGS